MAMQGDTFSSMVREVWTPELINSIFHNFWMFNGTFPVMTPPGGTSISTGYEYTETSSVGTYQYDDPMPTPGYTSQIRAYHNKDHFQESVRTFNIYKDFLSNGGNQTPSTSLADDRHALEQGMRRLRDKACTTMLGDIETDVDATNTYGDGSLVRATYNMTSYEESSSTALTLAHLEDAIEALMTHTTYGTGVTSEKDLIILAPRNQITNISRLETGVAYNSTFLMMQTNAQDMGPMDAGRVFRTKTFEGIDLVSVPDMTTTTILILHKPDVAIYETRPVTIVEKSEAADTNLWHLTCGYNAVVRNPVNSAKLSAKTA